MLLSFLTMSSHYVPPPLPLFSPISFGSSIILDIPYTKPLQQLGDRFSCTPFTGAWIRYRTWHIDIWKPSTPSMTTISLIPLLSGIPFISILLRRLYDDT